MPIRMRGQSSGWCARNHSSNKSEAGLGIEQVSQKNQAEPAQAGKLCRLGFVLAGPIGHEQEANRESSESKRRPRKKRKKPRLRCIKGVDAVHVRFHPPGKPIRRQAVHRCGVTVAIAAAARRAVTILARRKAWGPARRRLPQSCIPNPLPLGEIPIILRIAPIETDRSTVPMAAQRNS